MSHFADATRAAEAHLRALFPPTPCQLNAHLSARFGADVWLKREDLSPVRSYKIRGAFNAMRKVLAADPDRAAFVCASAGNHAQGVAFACAHFGVRGAIFMPVTTPQQKIMKTRIFGGEAVEIRLVGDYFDATLEAARAHCADVEGHFLSPFDDPDVIEGQATMTAEILAQMPALPDRIVLPVGGGGLSAGAAAFLAEAAPDVSLTLVEPCGAPSLTRALAEGEPVTVRDIDNFVDGASVARIGTHPFAALRGIDPADVLVAPEDRICVTLLDMLNVEGIVLEPAGALAVDALGEIADTIAGRTIVAVTTGGNFDFERLPDVKERAQRFAGLKKYLILRLPQRPGALKDFLAMLGPEDDIARFEYLKKSARNFGSVLIGIETGHAENFDRLFDRLAAHGFAFQDITANRALAEFLI